MRASIVYFVMISLLSCNENTEIDPSKSYYIVLIAGQSNTHKGIGFDPELDAPEKKIKQLGRHGDKDNRIIDATEPLHHRTSDEGKIGFGLTFAKQLIRILGEEKEVLIIPCGSRGTGFIDNRWNKGDDLYQDAIARVNSILKVNRENELGVILWQQGERDIKNTNYQKDLDDFIVNIRLDLHAQTVPFLIGGMVPFWVDQNKSRKDLEDIISSTSLRHKNVGYVDPRFPFVIQKDDNSVDQVHYSAEGQRELGKRYFDQYLKTRRKNK